jgi:3-hydroxymyristoyl/3-hydroxydecanoyl-(acyl carrier protein) dehydratase
MISNHPERTLPHRAPFLWVSRLVERSEDGNKGVVEFDVHKDLDVFRGHFPGQPIFPGVLQIEGAAQACCYIFLGELPEGKGPVSDVFFVSIEEFRFRKMVIPPATLRYHCEFIQKRGALFLWNIENKVGDEVVSRGKFWVKLDREGK